jgi:LCP family protein required for cell wall assembly
LVIALAMVVVGGGATGVYAYRSFHSATGHIHHSAKLTPGDQSGPDHDHHSSLKHSSLKGPVNVLLLGSDSRKPGTTANGGRSDTLMMLHLDADRKAAYLISFPRDLYVDIPGHGKNKINAAYSQGGPKLTTRTVQHLTGAHPKHVAMVNFDGFIKLTDELGGVTVQNDHAFTTHGYTFNQGKIKLSGKKALWFVRERHQLPHGDLSRAHNQRKVVQAILDKGLSGQTIARPGKFASFVSDLGKNVTVDNQLSKHDLRKLALSLRMGPGDIKQIQAPVTDFRTVPGVGDVDVLDHPKMKKLSHALRADNLAKYVKHNQHTN